MPVEDLISSGVLHAVTIKAETPKQNGQTANRGRRAPNGKIRISGAKNAALPIIAASLLTEEPVNISNSPHLHDVTTMIELLACLGVDVTLNEFMEVEIAARHLENYRAPTNL